MAEQERPLAESAGTARGGQHGEINDNKVFPQGQRSPDKNANSLIHHWWVVFRVKKKAAVGSCVLPSGVLVPVIPVGPLERC